MRDVHLKAVYQIKTPCGKIYIGSTQDLYKRIMQHKNKSHCKYLEKSILKNGFDKHEVKVLYTDNDINVLRNIEKSLIVKLKNDGVFVLNKYTSNQYYFSDLSAYKNLELKNNNTLLLGSKRYIQNYKYHEKNMSKIRKINKILN